MEHLIGNSALTIVYDGECPVCSVLFERYLKARSAGADIKLIDARTNPELVAELRHKHGISIDNDVAVFVDGRVYSGGLGLFVAFNGVAPASTFQWAVAKLIVAGYPVLRAGRWLLLRMLGRKRIEPKRAEQA